MTTWILLRGLGREARHWGRLPPLLEERLPGERVLTVDLPGSGRWWQQASPANVAGMVEAVRAELRARSRPGPYVVLALSLGGMVAMEWAARFPGELQGCILVNSSAGRLSPFWQRLRPGAWLQLAPWLQPRAGDLDRERAVYRVTSNLPLHDAVVDDWVAFARSRPVARRNLARQLFAAARYRAPARLPVPALVLASAQDRLVSPRASEAIARAWSLPLNLHPSAGHDLPLDDPDWVVQQAVDWVLRGFPGA
ncbi:MAG: alpha/beta hydrolase [Burkholderiales bacterium]|nr:alpha/beta hydrolase [Burkholderiales bacterium]